MSDDPQPLQIEIKEELNATMYWLGSVENPAARMEVAPGLFFGVGNFNRPWYHCKKCIDDGMFDFKARLSYGANFCPNCGTKLIWPEGDRR